MKDVLFFAQADTKTAYFTKDLKHALPFENKAIAWQFANLCTIVSGFENKVKKHSISDLYIVCHERDSADIKLMQEHAKKIQNGQPESN
jgi:hypothetical protein